MSTIQEQARVLQSQYNRKLVNAKTELWKGYVAEDAVFPSASSLIASYPATKEVVFVGDSISVAGFVSLQTIRDEYVVAIRDLMGDDSPEDQYPLITNNSAKMVLLTTRYVDSIRDSILNNSISWYKAIIDDPSDTLVDVTSKQSVYSSSNSILRGRLNELKYNEYSSSYTQSRIDTVKDSILEHVKTALAKYKYDLQASTLLNKSAEQIEAVQVDNDTKLALWNDKLILASLGPPSYDDVPDAEISNLLNPITQAGLKTLDSNIASNTKLKSERNLAQYYKTFSGTDSIISVVFPGYAPVVIGEASTLSYSIYRDKKPVITVGRITPKGFTKSSRTIAGTIVFTTLDKHWVNKIKEEFPELFRNISKIKADELPPFDVIINMGNEYGASAYYVVYGITIMEEAQILSVEDAMTQTVCKFMARDIDIVDNLLTGNITGSTKKNSKYYETLPRFKVAYDSAGSNPIPIYANVMSDDWLELSRMTNSNDIYQNKVINGELSLDTKAKLAAKDIKTASAPFVLSLSFVQQDGLTPYDSDLDYKVTVTYTDNNTKEYTGTYLHPVQPEDQVSDNLVTIDNAIGYTVIIRVTLTANDEPVATYGNTGTYVLDISKEVEGKYYHIVKI